MFVQLLSSPSRYILDFYDVNQWLLNPQKNLLIVLEYVNNNPIVDNNTIVKQNCLVYKLGSNLSKMIDNLTSSKNNVMNYTTRNRLGKNPIFIGYLLEKLNIENQKQMAKDLWGAFVIARDRLYPTPNENWKTISLREAERRLRKRFSLHLVQKKIEEGIIRTRNEQPYEQDIECLKLILDLQDEFFEKGALMETKDISGRGVYAVIPTSVNFKGVGKQEQKINSLEILLKHEFIREVIGELWKS